MKRAVWFGLAVAVAVLVTSAPAFAAQVVLKVNIPFQFVAAGRTYPAGAYEVLTESPSLLEIRAVNGKAEALVVVTRLAIRENSPEVPAQPEAVFDRVENRNVLSEIWSAGADGWLVAGTKEAHTHARVKGSAK